MKLFDVFKSALSNAKQAYKDVDKGKTIVLNPRSDRYTYKNQEDTNYDKNWKPTTKEEKETLSPEGYHRVDERADKKRKLMKGIYQSALRSGQSNEEAEKTFDDNYKEKQISIPSTAIKTIKYNPKSELLSVRFTSGSKTYDYPAVPVEVIQAFLKSPSKGQYFMANIHDQYSLYGKNHSPKNHKDQTAIKKYIKKYVKTNKNKWSK